MVLCALVRGFVALLCLRFSFATCYQAMAVLWCEACHRQGHVGTAVGAETSGALMVSPMGAAFPEDWRSPWSLRSAEYHQLQQGHQRMWETGRLEDCFSGRADKDRTKGLCQDWRMYMSVLGIQTHWTCEPWAPNKFAIVCCFPALAWSFLCFTGCEPASPTQCFLSLMTMTEIFPSLQTYCSF